MQNFLDINLATLNKSFKVNGVATRLEFWYFVAFTWLISLGASIADVFTPGEILENVVSLLLFIPSVTVGIRRMHDTDHAGWWLLFPVVNFVFMLSPSKPSRWAAQG